MDGLQNSPFIKVTEGYAHTITDSTGKNFSIMHSVTDIRHAIEKLEVQRSRYAMMVKELDSAITKRKALLEKSVLSQDVTMHE